MHTTMGDISLRLFPQQAPKTVENFTTHAKNGYYDGLKFHRVIDRGYAVADISGAAIQKKAPCQ